MIFELILIAGLIWFIWDKLKYEKYPPGPLRFPIIGNLVQITKESSFPAIAFQKLARKYGDVFYIQMGLRDTVVFNTLESIREILNHERCQDRSQDMLPMALERSFHKNLGLIWGNGKEWQALRRFTLRTLRDFGFGKAASIDVVINEEALKFIRHLEGEMKTNPEGVQNLTNLLSLTTINTLWRLITGVSYSWNDAEMLKLLKINYDVIKSTNFAMDLSIAYPCLYHWFPNKMGKTNQIEIMKRLGDFVQETVDRHRNLGDYKISPNCYVDVFLAKMEEEKGNPETVFTPDQLLLCLLDMFQAGADTTSNTLAFSILYMINHQNIQERIQKEIDENIGKEETMITVDARKKLPFTHATALECTRFSTVVPIPAARVADSDFFYKGYLIKKDVAITTNVYAAHFSEDIWKDPYNFRPERFLNQEGTDVDLKMASNLIQFGHGPRFCLGASLAESAHFIYFTTILRHFKIVNVSPEDLSIEPELGITCSPKPFKAKYIPRKIA